MCGPTQTETQLQRFRVRIIRKLPTAICNQEFRNQELEKVAESLAEFISGILEYYIFRKFRHFYNKIIS